MPRRWNPGWSMGHAGAGTSSSPIGGADSVRSFPRRCVRTPGRAALRAEMPDLVSVLDRVAVEGKGLLLLTGPGPAEAATGLAAILELLGERLPKRLALEAIGAQPSIVEVAPAADEEAVPTRA